MNAEVKADGAVELRIEREFAYTPEKVFEAWLQPEHLMQWMGPAETNVSNVSTDAREGGSYRMQFNHPDGDISLLNGVYKSIQRYTQLAFTWIWEKAEASEEETLVTLNFEPTANGTKLILLHQRFSSEELRDRHNWGWNGCLDKLESKAAELLG